jgi:hypothetical protein
MHCGAEFDEPKAIGDDADCGEVCPECHSTDFDDAVECDVCGTVIALSDAEGYDHHVCMDCIMKRKYDLPTLLKATEGKVVDEIEVPTLARYILTDEDIKTLIIRELERRLALATEKLFPLPFEFDATDYIKDYKSDLADYIGEEAS